MSILSTCAICLEHINKSFGKKQILFDVSLTIPEGCIYGLLGPSGCGKSTSVKIMAGISKPDSGKVHILGQEMPLSILANLILLQRRYFFMRIKALTIRILTQISHDKRTIALILIAPLVILSLVYFIFNSESSSYNLGIIAAPDAYIQELIRNDDLDIELTYLKREDVPDAIKNKEILAAIDMNPSMTKAKIYLDGTNSLDSEKIQALFKNTTLTVLQNNMKQNTDATKEKLNTLLDNLTQLKTKMPQVQLQVPEINLSELNMIEPTFTTDYIYGQEDASSLYN